MVDQSETKGKAWAFIFLLLLAPVMGELLSGSSPPNEFFNPFGFTVMTILYGGGAVLIREARVRWNLGYSIIFLAIAYGILEEGLLMQSFFNHNHLDLGPLTRYGMFLKCQWPWAIELTIYHATVSTLLPIMATDLLFPKLKNEPLIKKGGIITLIVLLVLDTIAMGALIIVEFGKGADPYIPSALNLMIWTAITLGLIYLAYRHKNKRHVETNAKLKSPFKLLLTSFIFIPVLIITPYALAENNVPALITTVVLLLFGVLTLLFTFRQMYNKDITVKHKVYVFAGVITSFVMLAVFNEFNNGIQGMAATGAVCFVLLLVYSAVVIRREGE